MQNLPISPPKISEFSQIPLLQLNTNERNSLANHTDCNTSRVRGSSMFEQEQSLPGSEHQLAIDDWHVFVDVSQHHANVRRHVIGPFTGVHKVRFILGHQAVEVSVQIFASRRIGIFHHDQTATGMANENRCQSILYRRSPDDSSDFVSDLVGALAPSRDGKNVADGLHLTFIFYRDDLL